ncbi:MAG: MFS transporter [Bacteroidetes bacterium]|nr:MFS transporter [Bacteroidota bacterium]
MKLKYFGHSTNDIFIFILPLILPVMLVKYELSYTAAGSILTLFMAILAIGSIVMGKLSDRFHREKLIGYGFFLASLGLTAAGFSTSLAAFLIIIALAAVGVSTFHPTMYAMIDDTVLEGKARVLGIYETYGTTAILIMYLVNGYLLTQVGTSGVLLITALPGYLMGFLFLKSGKNQLPTAHNPQNKKRKAIGKDKPMNPHFLIFILTIIFRILSVAAILNFLPILFVKVMEYELDKAAYATACFFAGGIPGSLIVGKLSSRWNPLPMLIISSIMIIPGIFLLSMQLPSMLYFIAVLLLGGFCSACIISQTVLLTKFSTNFGKGEIYGLMTGAITITSSISPMLFGICIDNLGFKVSIQLCTIPITVSVLLLLYLWKNSAAVMEVPV